MAAEKIIYDVGANNGDDIPYYLLKADVVVSIEANPVLCEGIRQRFAAEIEAGRLIVECCVVTDTHGTEDVDFYLHNHNHVLSQLPMPAAAERTRFTCIRLPARSIISIVEEHGDPYYIKIDIEHYDVPLLKALFASGIRPPYISAESHSIEVFATLVAEGGYRTFKLVDGPSVSQVYANRLIQPQRGQPPLRYSFPFHSAGPFGEDIDGDWLAFDSFFKLLAFSGLGWKDIHATHVHEADASAQPRFTAYLDGLISMKQLLAYTARRLTRSVRARLRGGRRPPPSP